MLVELTDETFSARRRAAANTLCRFAGGDGKRIRFFGSENSTVTVRSLNGRAVNNEHEQKPGYNPRNRGVTAKTLLMRLSRNHFEPCATFRVAMLVAPTLMCQRESWQ